MSPLKRHQRAKDKARARGRHARPEPERLRGGDYPIVRAPFVQLPGSPGAYGTEVPVELRSQEYEFPRVELPQSRPPVTAAQLREALDADADEQPTQPLPNVKRLAEIEALQPARHEGLAPAAAPVIPVPSLPFLNAHPPRPAAPERSQPPEPRHAKALPARLTDIELVMLGRPVPSDAPTTPSLPPAPEPYQAILRDTDHELLFTSFDAEFWRERDAEIARYTQQANEAVAQAVSAGLALDARMGRLEAERAAWDGMTAWLYEGTLADATAPLPRRTPGAALAEIEASRGELVDA